MLAIARLFAQEAPRHTIVFAALDAEESGLRGARAFVDDPPIPLDRIAIDVNLDMVSRNAEGELWVAGTHHSPSLRPFIERMAESAPVRLRIGHDRPGIAGEQDWTGSSDHGPFHAKGIPFLYFGVEDHADYHRESDEAEHIDVDFFTRSVQTIADITRTLDAELASLSRQGTGGEIGWLLALGRTVRSVISRPRWCRVGARLRARARRTVLAGAAPVFAHAAPVLPHLPH
jgi:Zn-dependent M28 family amino/carboxypeptidase